MIHMSVQNIPFNSPRWWSGLAGLEILAHIFLLPSVLHRDNIYSVSVSSERIGNRTL